MSKSGVRRAVSKLQAAQRCPSPSLVVHMPAEEENHMGWFCVEDDGNQIKKERHPLLVGHMPVTVAKQQEFKVMGGWVWRRGPLCTEIALLIWFRAGSHVVSPSQPLLPFLLGVFV